MADENRPQSPRDEPAVSTLGKAYSIGFEFAAAVAGFCIIGFFIDRWLGSTPKALITGAVLGIIGAMYNLIRQALRLTKRTETKQDNRRRDESRH